METKGSSDESKMGFRERLERDMKKIKEFTIEEMGAFAFSGEPPVLWIKEDFIRKHLTEWAIRTDKIYTDDPEELRVSKVRCPYCSHGFIRIVSANPDFSYGAGGRTGPFSRAHHVGDNYNFDCTNEDCGVTFFGTITHMCID